MPARAQLKALLSFHLQVSGSLPNTPTSVRSEYFTVPYGGQLEQHSSALQDELPDVPSFVKDVLGAYEDEAQSVAGQEQVSAATPSDATGGPPAGGGAQDAVAGGAVDPKHGSSTAAGLPPAEQDRQVTLEGQQYDDALKDSADAGPPAALLGAAAGDHAEGSDTHPSEQLQEHTVQQGVGCRPSSAHPSRRRAPLSLLPDRPATAPRHVLPTKTEGAEPSPGDSVDHRLRRHSPKQQQLRVVGLHVRSGGDHASLELSSGPAHEGQGSGRLQDCSSEDGAEAGGVPMDLYLTALRELDAAKEAAAFLEHHCTQIMWVTFDNTGKQGRCMLAAMKLLVLAAAICISAGEQHNCGYASF